jgi:hypothetical protein
MLLLSCILVCSTMGEPKPVVIFSLGKHQCEKMAEALKNHGLDDMDPQIQHNLIFTTVGFYTSSFRVGSAHFALHTTSKSKDDRTWDVRERLQCPTDVSYARTQHKDP